MSDDQQQYAAMVVDGMAQLEKAIAGTAENLHQIYKASVALAMNGRSGDLAMVSGALMMVQESANHARALATEIKTRYQEAAYVPAQPVAPDEVSQAMDEIAAKMAEMDGQGQPV